MTPQTVTRMKVVTYVLIALGFAGLIGAHEWGAGASDTAVPLVLAGAGTLCFVAAGLLARKLMKEGASN